MPEQPDRPREPADTNTAKAKYNALSAPKFVRAHEAAETQGIKLEVRVLDAKTGLPAQGILLASRRVSRSVVSVDLAIKYGKSYTGARVEVAANRDVYFKRVENVPNFRTVDPDTIKLNVRDVGDRTTAHQHDVAVMGSMLELNGSIVSDPPSDPSQVRLQRAFWIRMYGIQEEPTEVELELGLNDDVDLSFEDSRALMVPELAELGKIDLDSGETEAQATVLVDATLTEEMVSRLAGQIRKKIETAHRRKRFVCIQLSDENAPPRFVKLVGNALVRTPSPEQEKAIKSGEPYEGRPPGESLVRYLGSVDEDDDCHVFGIGEIGPDDDSPSFTLRGTRDEFEDFFDVLQESIKAGRAQDQKHHLPLHAEQRWDDNAIADRTLSSSTEQSSGGGGRRGSDSGGMGHGIGL